MASYEYDFVTRWRVEATCQQVYDILSDPLDLVRWWPEVYLEVTESEESHGGEKVYDLHTKGRLPYRLRWSMQRTEDNPPHGFALRAWGDLVGRGRWTFQQDGEWVDITYGWKVRADKPLLRRLSVLLRPLFEANHRWAMKKGEEALKRELAARRS